MYESVIEAVGRSVWLIVAKQHPYPHFRVTPFVALETKEREREREKNTVLI